MQLSTALNNEQKPFVTQLNNSHYLSVLANDCIEETVDLDVCEEGVFASINLEWHEGVSISQALNLLADRCESIAASIRAPNPCKHQLSLFGELEPA